MTALYSLIFATLVCSVYTFLIYATWFKNLSFFYVAVVVLGIGMSIPWGFIVRYTPTKESLFLYSIAWDVMVTVVSLLIPIFFYAVRFSFLSWIGIGIIVIGLIILKLANLSQ